MRTNNAKNDYPKTVLKTSVFISARDLPAGQSPAAELSAGQK